MQAYSLFGDSYADSGALAVVENVVVEFGPPNRWRSADDTAEDGAAVLAHMATLGFETRLVDSQVWNEYKAILGRN
eukprot:SAG31_NODE_17184_length_680_cov_0.798623_2_plen_75_part_01